MRRIGRSENDEKKMLKKKKMKDVKKMRKRTYGRCGEGSVGRYRKGHPLVQIMQGRKNRTKEKEACVHI